MPHTPHPDVQWLKPRDLYLDPQNPRIAGHDFGVDEQLDILEWLWKNKAVNELIDSIATSGFWYHEELFACEEGGKRIVIEGNRRLAAVKILTDTEIRSKLGIAARALTPEVAESLRLLPVLVQPRREIWEFIGFKHVNGPQAWDSLAKAQYVHRVHHEFGVPLTEIAQTIGDRHETVARLYRGLLVLEQAREQGLFESEDAAQKKFPFSHLWTALGYTSVQKFLGVTGESLLNRSPVPQEKREELQNLLEWLYGSRKKEIEPKIRRQTPDLRELAESIEMPKGVQALRAGLPLSAALEARLGDERLFQDAMAKAEEQVRNAKRFVATGYHGEEHLYESAANIEKIGKSLRLEMLEMRTGQEES